MIDYVSEIKEIAKDMGDVKIMEVCGGHTNTIMKYGIREILPDNIKLISGPGCPVCVTSQKDIDSMIEIVLSGEKVATYGDMVNVPGTKMSLKDAKAKGADVKTIYSADELLEDKDRIFFAVGFETTTPMTATLLEQGIKVFSTHKIMFPAMKLLVDKMDIQGFVDPGHVSAIIGSDIWEEMNLGIPQVICGFKPEMIIKGIYNLLKLIKENKKDVINDYPEVVMPEVNIVARNLIEKTMKIVDSEWRGIGVISKSGLVPRDEKLDARIIFKDLISNIKSKENPMCRCGEVIKGLIEPKNCPLFKKICTPENPVGACMVSESEGACAIAYKYGKSLGE